MKWLEIFRGKFTYTPESYYCFNIYIYSSAEPSPLWHRRQNKTKRDIFEQSKKHTTKFSCIFFPVSLWMLAGNYDRYLPPADKISNNNRKEIVILNLRFIISAGFVSVLRIGSDWKDGKEEYSTIIQYNIWEDSIETNISLSLSFFFFC